MTDEEAEDIIHEMIGEAAFGDSEKAGELLRKLGMSHTSAEMFVVCATIAEYGAAGLRHAAGDAVLGGAVMVVPRSLPPEMVAEHPAEAFAERFIAAWANGDHEMCQDLFVASLELTDQQHVDGVAALVSLSAHLTRKEYEEKYG